MDGSSPTHVYQVINDRDGNTHMDVRKILRETPEYYHVEMVDRRYWHGFNDRKLGIKVERVLKKRAHTSWRDAHKAAVEMATSIRDDMKERAEDAERDLRAILAVSAEEPDNG